MVQFSKYFATISHQTPHRWSYAYVHYADIRRTLKILFESHKSEAAHLPSHSCNASFSSNEGYDTFESVGGMPRSPGGAARSPGGVSPTRPSVWAYHAVRAEVEEEAVAYLTQLEQQRTVFGRKPHSFHEAMKLEIEKVVGFTERILKNCALRVTDAYPTSDQKLVAHEVLSDLQLYLDINNVALLRLGNAYARMNCVGPAYNVVVELEHLATLSKEIDMVLEQIVPHVQAYIETPALPSWQVFRLGFLLAICLVLAFNGVTLEAAALSGLTGAWDVDALHAVFPIFRCQLVAVVGLWMWGIVLHVLCNANVNYMYILDLHPVRRIGSADVIEVSEINTIWLFACMMAYMQFPPELRFVLLVVSPMCVVATCIYPGFRHMREGRNTLFSTLQNLLHLPGGHVRFRDFFVADWAVSLIIPFCDLATTLGYFLLGFEIGHPLEPSTLLVRDTVLKLVPSYWRSVQTVKRYHSTAVQANLWNTGKYMTAATAIVVGSVCGTRSTPFFCVACVSLVYSLAWDFLMDWGWIKGTTRPLKLPLHFHICIGVYNTLARCFFLVPPMLTPVGWTCLAGIVEIVRRGLWSILRLENEHLHNLEKYRSVDHVPSVQRILNPLQPKR
eukprot:PhM_4_TR13576/c0_g1_i1/m.90276